MPANQTDERPLTGTRAIAATRARDDRREAPARQGRLPLSWELLPMAAAPQAGAVADRRSDGTIRSIPEPLRTAPVLVRSKVRARTPRRQRVVLAELDPPASQSPVQVEELPRSARRESLILDVLGTAFVFAMFLAAAAYL